MHSPNNFRFFIAVTQCQHTALRPSFSKSSKVRCHLLQDLSLANITLGDKLQRASTEWVADRDFAVLPHIFEFPVGIEECKKLRLFNRKKGMLILCIAQIAPTLRDNLLASKTSEFINPFGYDYGRLFTSV